MLPRITRTSVLALGSALTLSACSAGSTATQVGRLADSGVIVGTVGAPASLDFTTTAGAAIPQALMGNVYETLVRIDPDSGMPSPWLATNWELSEDAHTYVFTLRDDVHFSNRDKFNAETAAFSINYVLNEWTNGLARQMAPVDKAEATAPYELTVTLNTPDRAGQWLWSMGTLTGAMMSPKSIETLASDPIGTGPYTVERFAVGESITFAAREDYWSTPAQDAGIRYFADSIGAVNALRAGDIDVVWSLQTPELLDTLPEEYGVEVGTTNGEVLLSMNNERAPFDDPSVRQAVAYGIDREALNQVVWEGRATDTGGAPVPPSDPWYTGTNYYPFDLERARQLLAESSYDGSTVTLTVPSLPYAENAAELLYSQLHDIGFKVELATAEFPAIWLADVMGAADYHMSLIAHVEPRDVPNLFGNPDYYLRYDNAEVRKLLAQGDTESMKEAVDLIMADAGALTVVNAPNIVLTAPGVSGVRATVVTDSLPLAPMEKP